MDSNQEFTSETLQRRLPENSIAYSVFIDSSENNRQIASRLKVIKKESQKFVENLTKDYIWQRGEFKLELSSDSSKCHRQEVHEHS